MKKRGILALLALLVLALALEAGAEELFSEESFQAAGGFGEESVFDETFFGGDEFFFEDIAGEELPAAELDPAAEEAADDRSLFTVTPDQEVGEWEYDDDNYWKEAPFLTATAAKGGKVTLSWVQDLYTLSGETRTDKTAFPSKDIQYYVYELNENGSMTQVKKPVSIGKKWGELFEDEDSDPYTGMLTTLTLSGLTSGSHTFAVRAEKLTKSAKDKKLAREEYGEISNLVTVTCFYDDVYKLSNLRVEYDYWGDLELDFVADYDLVAESGAHYGDGWFEVVAKLDLMYYDEAKDTYKKGSATATYKLDEIGWGVDEWDNPSDLGYNGKGKGLGNPVAAWAGFDVYEYDKDSFTTKPANLDEDEIYFTKGSFTLQYVMVDEKTGKKVVKSKLPFKVTFSSDYEDDSSYYEEWKTADWEAEAGDDHTVDITLYTNNYASEYVLGGLTEKLSVVHNYPIYKETETETYEGKKYTDINYYADDSKPIYEDYKDYEWLLYNTKTKQVIQGLSDDYGDLYLEGLEAAGNKSTAKITVQPKQTTINYKVNWDKDGDFKVAGKSSASGKSSAQTVTLWKYWKMAPQVTGWQSGDKEVRLGVVVMPGTQQVSVAGFADSVNVKIDREAEYTEDLVTLADANPKKPGIAEYFTISGVEAYDDGTVEFVLSGQVKKEGNVKFTVTSVEDNGKQGFNKGDKTTAAVPVIAASASAAVNVNVEAGDKAIAVSFRHINENVVRYAVSGTFSVDSVYGTQGHDIRTYPLERVEVSDFSKMGDDGSLTVNLTLPKGTDMDNWDSYSVLVEGFTEDGSRVVTGYSLY